MHSNELVSACDAENAHETVSGKITFLFRAITSHFGQGLMPATKQWLLLLCCSVEKDYCTFDILRHGGVEVEK